MSNLAEKKLAPGETLPVGGGYQLVELLATGTNSQVWKAHSASGKVVAVKVLKLAGDDPNVQRELKSLELVKQLHHAYLLDVYDYFAEEDALVVSMRLADGNLEGRLKACQ